MKSRFITVFFTLAALSSALVLCGTATAATSISRSGTTGNVYEAAQPVTCSGWASLLRHDATLVNDVVINPPTVYAAALANGSRSQYVSYRADVYDFYTGQNTLGTFTNWFSASTSTPAQLPRLFSSVSAYHRIGVRIHVIWWDPTAQKYSGTLDYTVNAYYNLNYSPTLFSTTGC